MASKRNGLFGVLETDMMVAEVFVAVAKAKSGVAVSEKERQAARKLKESLAHRDPHGATGNLIPSALVPDAHVRGLLEKGLAEITRANSDDRLAPASLKKLTDGLGTLSTTGRLSHNDADELLTTLERLGAPVELEGSVSMLIE